MSGKPRLLDLFCGAGGAAMGYHRAGFEVVGVDIAPQPHYPFEFWQADALDVLRDLPRTFHELHSIHASPPCQKWSEATPDASIHPDLVGPVRDLLLAIGLPSVIENVPAAPLSGPILCGTSFGLVVETGELWRHRRFEAIGWEWPLLMPGCAHRQRERVLSVTGTGYGGKHKGHNGNKPAGIQEGRAVMGIDWMTIAELSEAIPPAYTEFIGEQLLRYLSAVPSTGGTE